MTFDVRVEGLQRIQRVLQSIIVQNTKLLDDPIQLALVHAYSKVSPYPPVPPDSTYQRGTDPRSEQLSKQWDYEGSGLSQSLVNGASYSGYVHGRKQPAYHKRTGWITVESMLASESSEIARIITSGYIRNVRRLG